MNLSQLLSGMSEETFKELNSAVYKEQTIRAAKQAESLPDLNREEKKLACMGQTVAAIQQYRARMNLGKELNAIDWCSVQVSKIKVGQYLSPPKDFIKAAPDNHWE